MGAKPTATVPVAPRKAGTVPSRPLPQWESLSWACTARHAGIFTVGGYRSEGADLEAGPVFRGGGIQPAPCFQMGWPPQWYSEGLGAGAGGRKDQEAGPDSS